MYEQISMTSLAAVAPSLSPLGPYLNANAVFHSLIRIKGGCRQSRQNYRGHEIYGLRAI
jgi:hypothetical protein